MEWSVRESTVEGGEGGAAQRMHIANVDTCLVS